jgi:hypothetical protein
MARASSPIEYPSQALYGRQVLYLFEGSDKINLNADWPVLAVILDYPGYRYAFSESGNGLPLGRSEADSLPRP